MWGALPGQGALEERGHQDLCSFWGLRTEAQAELLRSWLFLASEIQATLLFICTWRWGGASKGSCGGLYLRWTLNPWLQDSGRTAATMQGRRRRRRRRWRRPEAKGRTERRETGKLQAGSFLCGLVHLL